MERPEAIRHHVMHLRRIQARIAGNLTRHYRPTTATTTIGCACRVPTHVRASGRRSARGLLF